MAKNIITTKVTTKTLKELIGNGNIVVTNKTAKTYKEHSSVVITDPHATDLKRWIGLAELTLFKGGIIYVDEALGAKFDIALAAKIALGKVKQEVLIAYDQEFPAEKVALYLQNNNIDRRHHAITLFVSNAYYCGEVIDLLKETYGYEVKIVEAFKRLPGSFDEETMTFVKGKMARKSNLELKKEFGDVFSKILVFSKPKEYPKADGTTGKASSRWTIFELFLSKHTVEMHDGTQYPKYFNDVEGRQVIEIYIKDGVMGRYEYRAYHEPKHSFGRYETGMSQSERLAYEAGLDK